MSFAERLGPYVWRDLHIITYFDRTGTGLQQCVAEGYPCHTCRPNFAANRACVEHCDDAWVWWHKLHNTVNEMKDKPAVDSTQVDHLQPYTCRTMEQWEAYAGELRQRYHHNGSWYPGFIRRMYEWADYIR